MRTDCRSGDPAVPPAGLSCDELEERGQQPIAPGRNSPAPSGQLESNAPPHVHELLQFVQTAEGAELIPEGLPTTRGPFRGERGRPRWQIDGDVAIARILI